MHPIYLDHNATTPIDPHALQVMLPYLREEFGNPSSLYPLGRRAHVAIENARLHELAIKTAGWEREVQDARAVQLALIPEQKPTLSGYAFWHYYEPARFVGGDYFDYRPVRKAECGRQILREARLKRHSGEAGPHRTANPAILTLCILPAKAS